MLAVSEYYTQSIIWLSEHQLNGSGRDDGDDLITPGRRKNYHTRRKNEQSSNGSNKGSNSKHHHKQLVWRGRQRPPKQQNQWKHGGKRRNRIIQKCVCTVLSTENDGPADEDEDSMEESGTKNGTSVHHRHHHPQGSVDDYDHDIAADDSKTKVVHQVIERKETSEVDMGFASSISSRCADGGNSNIIIKVEIVLLPYLSILLLYNILRKW